MSQAAATSINPSTGEFLSAPGTYLDTGALNRLSQAAATTVNPSTGDLTGTPTTYPDRVAHDRSDVAAATSVNPTTGEFLGFPSEYRVSNIVPALSPVMAAVLALLLLGSGSWFLARRRRLSLG